MKKIKITEVQEKKLKESLVEPHIDKWIEKSDVSALAHHYGKSDDEGKAKIMNKVKSHAKGGEVMANKVSLRSRDAKKTLEETNGVIDGISGADDEAIDKLVEDVINELTLETDEDKLDETTTSASSGQYSSKFFIKKGKPNDNLQYPGGSVVTANPKTHTQGVNSIIKGKLKEEEMKNVNEQVNSVIGDIKESYFKAMSLKSNMTSRHDDFAHYTPKKRVSEEPDFDETQPAPENSIDTGSENSIEDSSELPQFTASDLLHILDSLKNDVGGEHPTYNHLKEILTHFADMDNPDAPVSPQVIKAFRTALPDGDEEQDQQGMEPEPEGVTEFETHNGEEDFDSSEFAGLDDMSFDFDDSNVIEPTDDERQAVANHMKMNSKYGFTDTHMANEGDIDEKSDLAKQRTKLFHKSEKAHKEPLEFQPTDHSKVYADLENIYKSTGKITKGDAKTVAYDNGLDFSEALEMAIDVINEGGQIGETTGSDNLSELDDHQIFQNLKVEASRKADEKFMEILKIKGKITKGDVKDVAYEFDLDFQEAKENALDIIYDYENQKVDETTGSASSGQVNGALIRRNPAPEEPLFEDSREENYYDSKYIDANMANFTDREGMLAQSFGKENVHTYEKSYEGNVVFVNYQGKYEIGMLKNSKFFVKMDDGNYDKYNVFDNLQDIIEAIKSFGSEDDQSTDMMQEEYSKPSPAMTNLKKVHQATEDITKSEMGKAGDIVKKGSKTSGVQFTGKVADEVENKSVDNTEAQEKFNMISKGMEDLDYQNDQSKIFTKNFENGIKPVVKSAAVTDQHGNKYPAADHANVVDSDLGDNILADVEKKKEAKVPQMDNFVQQVKIVKEGEDVSEIIEETDDKIITKEEQNKINEDVANMKKLLGYKPETYTSTKGNKIDNSLFKSKN